MPYLRPSSMEKPVGPPRIVTLCFHLQVWTHRVEIVRLVDADVLQECLEDVQAYRIPFWKYERFLIWSGPFLMATFPARSIKYILVIFESLFQFGMGRNVESCWMAEQTIRNYTCADEAKWNIRGLKIIWICPIENTLQW